MSDNFEIEIDYSDGEENVELTPEALLREQVRLISEQTAIANSALHKAMRLADKSGTNFVFHVNSTAYNYTAGKQNGETNGKWEDNHSEEDWESSDD